MRVLATTHPASGHLHPLVPLLRGLSERGHEVLAATSRAFCPAVEAVGLPAVAVWYEWPGSEGPSDASWILGSSTPRPVALFVPPAPATPPHSESTAPSR